MDVVASLAQVLPPDAVLVDADRLASYRNDQAPGVPAGTPLAVVFPRSTEQVAAVLRLAHEHGTAVVPRGAGSGLSGGANAVDGALTLCLDRMAAVLEIDPGRRRRGRPAWRGQRRAAPAGP